MYVLPSLLMHIASGFGMFNTQVNLCDERSHLQCYDPLYASWNLKVYMNIYVCKHRF